ncbi:ribonuclease J [Paenibacillus alkalitolerans]|uniref:ribonuclease J n=1 Tax=Paenibacillus alkalitolerans TaxID=2799335 RepID=UPI001F36BF63|nr:ribonuclease J [Paenibacillus alkalitolerans]
MPENNMPNKRTSYVKIFALGGLDEIGKNMYAVQFGHEIIVIDSGVKFPGPDMPGVDYIIPNIRYLVEHQEMVKAIILTHGHEDHIGGLPFVLQQLNVPIYGASLTIGFVRAKLEEHGLLNQTQLHIVNEDSTISFNKMTVQFFRTHHSIPDSLGIVVQTPQGNIVHTGDFKFDFTPVDKQTDWSRLAEIGRQGVLALLADSTNSEKPGFTPSERTVGNSIRDTFRNCGGRILFATFASNVHRLQQVVEAAEETGRKIAIIGRSMERAFRIGQELGYIRPAKEMIIDMDKIDQYPDNSIVIVCTGSQGEPNAALTRIANGSHKYVSVYPGDTVIFSSSPIPGNTQNVNRSIDRLLRSGAEVISGSIFDIHASGHGCREDLKLMHAFMKPTYFMPIHGEHRMLVQHAQLAEGMGLERKNIFVMDNGQTLTVSKHMAKVGKTITAGNILVKGKMMNEWESTVMEERKRLSGGGVMIVNLVVDSSRNKLLAGPDLVTRGFIYVREAGDTISHATKLIKRTIAKLEKREKFDRKLWDDQIVNTLSAYTEGSMGRSPLILPVIMDVVPKEKRSASV